MRYTRHPARRAALARLLTLAGALRIVSRSASATPLDPTSFTSLGTLNVTAGSITIDTTALTITGAATFSGVSFDQGTTTQNGVVDFDRNLAAFDFGGINISSGVTVNVFGARPLALLSRGDFTLDAVVSVNGGFGTGGGGGIAGTGGAGGGAGGIGLTGIAAGNGPGRGSSSGGAHDGGGAAFGGNGGSGLRNAIAGVSYGDLLSRLQAGSGGGGASDNDIITAGGGGGAGAIELGAVGSLSVTGTLTANGGNAGAASVFGGGGSGGGFLLHATNVNVATPIQARGGTAGINGGGGSGGRIAVSAPVMTPPQIQAILASSITGGQSIGASVRDGRAGAFTIKPDLLVINAGQTLIVTGMGTSQTTRSDPRVDLQIGNLTLNAGGIISLDGAVTNNASHTFSLLGGVLSAPSVTNSSGAVISGFGQITGNFINSGSTSFFGPTQIVGNFTNNAGAVVAVRNAQTLIVGTAINNGSITTSNGTIIFDSGAPGPTTGGGVDGAGTLLVNPGTHLITSFVRQSALSISGTLGNAGIATVRARSDGGSLNTLSSLNIAGNPGSLDGILDLADNDAIITATPIQTIAGYVAGGFNGGPGNIWKGNGINSSIAAQVAADSANPHKTALGYASALSIGVSAFDGQSVAGSAVLVQYTYVGDANLDGRVNALDFNAVATNFGAATGKVWYQGDFNYDGTVNTQDFTTLASNFNQALPASMLGSLLPEPMSMSLLVGVGAMPLARRRRPTCPAGT